MRKLKRWIVPILIGLAGGIFLFKSEMGKKLLAKVPFLNNEA